MRELYELVLKTVKEVNEPIFRNEFYGTNDPFYSNSVHKYLDFILEFEDGDPNIEIVYKQIKKTEEYKKYFWSKKKKRTKSYDKVYRIKAGKLEYETTIIEAKVLDEAVKDLLDRVEKIQKEEEVRIILNRLEGNAKVVKNAKT